MRLLIALLIFSLSSACTSLGSNLEDDLIQAPPPPDSLISPPILVIADNQQTMEYRQGNFETTIGLKYALGIRSATRPRALTLWSLNIIEKIAAIEAEANIVLHLGDVLNNSCLSEWEQVRDKLDLIRQDAWYIAPGNHDGYYFGLTHPMPGDNGNAGNGPLNEYAGWSAACIPLNERVDENEPTLTNVDNEIRIKHILDKSDFVQNYLNVLIERGVDLPDQTCGAVDHATLRGICFNIDTDEPWRSFIVQYIVIGETSGIPVHIVITDTSAFDYQPQIVEWWLPKFKSAYHSVNFLESVLEATSYWLSRIDPDNTVVLAGHHPFEKFAGGRAEILELWGAGLFDVYMSGDTHDGLVKRHHTNSSGQGLLEVNMGSLLDPPIEYRILRAYQTPSGGRGLQMERTFMTPPSNRDRDGYVRFPGVSPVFEECLRAQDSLLSKDSSLAEMSRLDGSHQALQGLVTDKGFGTRRDILIDEANLYRNLAETFSVEPNWSALPNPVSGSVAHCELANAETLEGALVTLTSEKLSSCWPQQQGQQTFLLAQMSKVLNEASSALDAAIDLSPDKSSITEYKVCEALISSHHTL